MTRKPMAAATFAAALIALAGCGNSSSAAPASNAPASSAAASSSQSAQSGSPASSASNQMVTIKIKDYKYSGPDSVSPGATVTVMNEDAVNHTLTADTNGGFDVTITAGKSATFTAPTTPGTYKYHCTFHANMMGALVVK
ncbi:MAG: cupredoxin domain-containing protein [Antricoccus sp.]